MGLGKTIQTIAFVLSVLGPAKEEPNIFDLAKKKTKRDKKNKKKDQDDADSDGKSSKEETSKKDDSKEDEDPKPPIPEHMKKRSPILIVVPATILEQV